MLRPSSKTKRTCEMRETHHAMQSPLTPYYRLRQMSNSFLTWTLGSRKFSPDRAVTVRYGFPEDRGATA